MTTESSPPPPAPALAALARIRVRCNLLLAGNRQHIQIGELYRLIGTADAPTPAEPFGWFTPCRVGPVDEAPLLADVAATHPELMVELTGALRWDGGDVDTTTQVLTAVRPSPRPRPTPGT